MFARLPFGTEASEIVRTEALARMSLGADGAEWTEAPVVMFTSREPSVLPDVMVQAILAVGAVSGAQEGLTFGHAPEVVLVEIFAFEPLLAQPL